MGSGVASAVAVSRSDAAFVIDGFGAVPDAAIPERA